MNKFLYTDQPNQAIIDKFNRMGVWVEKRWYVVNTKFSAEEQATYQLRAQSFEVFFPEYQEKYLKKQIRLIRTRALYPSYIFVHFNIEQDPWYKIKNTRGVREILSSSADHAIPVKRGFVEKLIEASEQVGTLIIEEKPQNHDFKIGQEVQVNAINFSGIVGKITELKKDKVLINTALLSRQITLSLPYNLVSPLYVSRDVGGGSRAA